MSVDLKSTLSAILDKLGSKLDDRENPKSREEEGNSSPRMRYNLINDLARSYFVNRT
jgi:hypothetical protein